MATNERNVSPFWPHALAAIQCTRSAFWLAAILLVSIPPAAHAQPNSTAAAVQNFVRLEMEAGLSIVNNRSIPEMQRRVVLRAFLASFMDFRRLALFSLGPARSYLKPRQIDQFVDVFRSFAIADFESLLTNYYSGQGSQFVSCRQINPDTYDVDIALDSAPGAQAGSQPIDVDVRVVAEDGRFVITDLATVGIWLGVQQRDEIAEYLLETNGNFSGLLLRYRVLTQRKQNEISDTKSAT